MDLEEGEIIISDVSSEDDLQPLFKGYRIQERKSNLLRPESDEPTSSFKTSHKEKSYGVRSYWKGQVRESVKDKNVSNTCKSRCLEGRKIGIGSSKLSLGIFAENMSRMSLSASMLHNTNSKFNATYKMRKKRKRSKRSSHTVKVNSIDLKKSVYGKKKLHDTDQVHKTVLRSERHFKHTASGHNYSLMNKLITSGLAKKFSTSKSESAEVSSTISSPEANIFHDENICLVDLESSVTKQEAILSNNNKITKGVNANDEDSEIEVIVPPKKIPPLVTLDSDGEEVDFTNTSESLSKQHSSNVKSLDTSFEKCMASSSQNKDLIKENTVKNEHCNYPILSNMTEESVAKEFSDSSSVKFVGSEEELEPYSPTSPSTCSYVEKDQCSSISNIDIESTSFKNQENFEDPYNSHICNKLVDFMENVVNQKTDPLVSQHFGECIQVNTSSLKENDNTNQDKSTLTNQDYTMHSFTYSDQNNHQKSEVPTIEVLFPKIQKIDEFLSDSSQEARKDKEPYSTSSFCNINIGKKLTQNSYNKNTDTHSEFPSINNYLEKFPTDESQGVCSVNINITCTANEKKTSNLKLDSGVFNLDSDAHLKNINIKPVDIPRAEINKSTNEKVIENEKSSFEQPQSTLSEYNNTQYNDNNSKLKSDDEDDLSQLRLIALSTKGKSNQNLIKNKDQINTKEPANQTNTSADDDYDDEEEDILQLRVAALKSAVIKKHEERKKRGLQVKKRHRESSDDFLPLLSAPESSFSSKTSLSEGIMDSPLSIAEITDSMQGEEDMEIASDSGGDIIQDGNSQEKSELINQPCKLWESPITNATISTVPDCSVVSGTNLSKYPVVPVQPLPPGVDPDFTDGCSNQAFSSVLPPPPPPPTTLIFSLAPPPPPPPLPSSPPNMSSQQISMFQKYKNDQLSASFDQSNYTTPSISGTSQYATIEDIVYHGKSSFCSMSYKTTDFATNDGICLSDVAQVHDDLQSKLQFDTDLEKGEISKLNLRPNLKTIPVLFNIPKKVLTKKKLKKMQRHKLRSKHRGLNQEPKLLCITNTPNFCKSRSKVNVLQRPKNRSSELCSTNVMTSGITKQLTFQNQESLSLGEENTYTVNNNISDSKYSSPFQEDEMDLSEMIVLDEVGMSPEHKPIDDKIMNLSKDEEDENTLRARALTSLSSNTVSNRTAYGLTSKMFSRKTHASKCIEIKDISFRNDYIPCITTNVGNKRKELENISVTRRVDVNDSSKYRLTRVVRKEPRRSVVQGKESLKIVIPSESPPLVSHPSPPVVDRLVINIGQDSDTDEDSEWMRKVRIEENENCLPPGPVVDHELERSIDLLLLNARQTIENSEPISFKQKEDLYTPKNKQFTKRDMDLSETPLRLLSKEKQEEYYRLKKIIEEKERGVKNQSRLFEQKQKKSEADGKKKMPQQVHINTSQYLVKNRAACFQTVNQKSVADQRNCDSNQQNDTMYFKECTKDKSDNFCISFGKSVLCETKVSNQMQDISHQTKVPNQMQDVSHQTKVSNQMQDISHQTKVSNQMQDISHQTKVPNQMQDISHQTKVPNQMQDISHQTKVSNQMQDISHQTKVPSQMQDISHQTKVPNQMQDISHQTKVSNQMQDINHQTKVPNQMQDISHQTKVSNQMQDISHQTKASNQRQDISSQTSTDIAESSALNRKKDTAVCNKQNIDESGCIESKSSSQEIMLSSNKAQLLNERFLLIDDLSKMSESLSELEREQASANKEVMMINNLRKALQVAEERLLAQTAVTQKLELNLFEAHQAVYKRYSQIQQLETKCRELGTCLSGSEYEIPVFGYELMWNKIKQVSKKRDEVIAKREMIRTLMENSYISNEELTNVIAHSNVEHESAAEKHSLLQSPNKSVFTPLPVDMFIIDRNKDVEFSCTLNPSKPHCEEPEFKNLILEGQHFKITSTQVESSESLHPATSSVSSENPACLSPNSVSCKIIQHNSSEAPKYYSLSESRSETHLSSNEKISTENKKFQESQLLEQARESESSVGHISQSLKMSANDFVKKHQCPETSGSDEFLTKNVLEKRKISEVNDSLNELSYKRINLSEANIQSDNIGTNESYSKLVCDMNEVSECEAANVSVSKPVKSHFKYKSVLQYKKPISSIPSSEAVREILCRYEILGKCQDKKCKYKHFSPSYRFLRATRLSVDKEVDNPLGCLLCMQLRRDEEWKVFCLSD